MKVFEMIDVRICAFSMLSFLCACTSLAPQPPTITRATSGLEFPKLWGDGVVAACAAPEPGRAQCLALVRTSNEIPDGGSGPGNGFTPAQLQAAYSLPVSKGAGQIVSIVDAYDDPNIVSDLAYYRSYFGLPQATFTKYNQEGQKRNFPPANAQWALEETLDVDMVSASCPNCSIALVEANDDTLANLQAAAQEAVALRSHIVSNSYGCVPGPGCTFKKSGYDAKGVTYVAAAGDYGFVSGVLKPAAFSSVVSAGGTSLYVDPKAARGYRETAWLGTGSGCNGDPKPAWQHDPGCMYRTGNDVAAVSDPATGPAIYDTFGLSGWFVGGGTSAAAPFIAGVFGLAGNPTQQNGGETIWTNARRHPNRLYRVLQGHNGSCNPSYLCTDGTHEYFSYGGPTGWGTPNGISAF
jgi:subtilase family serine protease